MVKQGTAANRAPQQEWPSKGPSKGPNKGPWHVRDRLRPGKVKDYAEGDSVKELKDVSAAESQANM